MIHKIALLDVDGTLFDGNIGTELVKTLTDMNIFSKEICDGIFDWYKKYKDGSIEKHIAVDKCYQLFSKGLKGKNPARINNAAKKAWYDSCDKLFDFTADVISILKKEGFEIFLISGSPIEMIQILADFLSIKAENLIAGEQEIVDGIYTGKSIFYPAKSEQKVEAINNLIKNRNMKIDFSKSVAMGNNERDCGILEMVGKPIVFEPNEKLYTIAKSLGWSITNRENLPGATLQLIQEPTVP